MSIVDVTRRSLIRNIDVEAERTKFYTLYKPKEYPCSAFQTFPDKVILHEIETDSEAQSLPALLSIPDDQRQAEVHLNTRGRMRIDNAHTYSRTRQLGNQIS
jgi:hypothetical protein